MTQSEKKWFRKRTLSRRDYLLVVAAFTLAGVVGGYTYYALVGCKTGGCAITGSPVMSVIWGGLMGYLFTDFFVRQEQQA